MYFSKNLYCRFNSLFHHPHVTPIYYNMGTLNPKPEIVAHVTDGTNIGMKSGYSCLNLGKYVVYPHGQYPCVALDWIVSGLPTHVLNSRPGTLQTLTKCPKLQAKQPYMQPQLPKVLGLLPAKLIWLTVSGKPQEM